jgi:prophage antirepressor-like protein
MSMVAPPQAPGDSRGLQRFDFHGAEIRTLMIDGNPWWVAADVCGALGIADTRKSVSYLDEDERTTSPVTDSLGREQQTYIVNEPGLYSLILRSRKPQAKDFKRWVTHEVLPSIRRTGSYSVAEVSRKELALMVIQAEEEKEVLTARVRELEPAAQAWDVLASASGDYSLRDAAFILNRDPAISTGQNRLLRSIREFDMIDRNGVPYAKHAAHLVERATSYNHPHTGEPVLSKQVRVTAQGLRYLHRRLGGEVPLQLPLPEAS